MTGAFLSDRINPSKRLLIYFTQVYVIVFVIVLHRISLWIISISLSPVMSLDNCISVAGSPSDSVFLLIRDVQRQDNISMKSNLMVL